MVNDIVIFPINVVKTQKKCVNIPNKPRNALSFLLFSDKKHYANIILILIAIFISCLECVRPVMG